MAGGRFALCHVGPKIGPEIAHNSFLPETKSAGTEFLCFQIDSE
jgi:hypothetical protein